MKKFAAAAAALALLGACADSATSLNTLGSGSGIGSSMVKMAVESQCRTELGKRNEWRLAALAMTAEKQAEWENKICGCVSEEAPNQVSANDLMQVLSPTTRAQTVASVTAKTVTACVQRLFK
ncbi:hypothetical protein [Bergeriella denitrificans]|uniref:Lipoprotein n=1 Tax=Bergeriella denitrificans TaxID=494 RepID=A0A378UH76_BERDE|nr:hypothetical protein [Bergeriella denitrificans]STZ76490.1 lipoprotein [Bergeriella denitrificans]